MSGVVAHSISDKAQRRHRRSHHRSDEAPENCWECQRDQARCRSKLRYGDVQEAVEAALNVNIVTQWSRMLRPYRCHWCTSYHLASALPRTRQWKNVERLRRKWLRGGL